MRHVDTNAVHWTTSALTIADRNNDGSQKRPSVAVRPLVHPPKFAFSGFDEVYSLWTLTTLAKGGLDWSTLQIGQVRQTPKDVCAVSTLTSILCKVNLTKMVNHDGGCNHLASQAYTVLIAPRTACLVYFDGREYQQRECSITVIYCPSDRYCSSGTGDPGTGKQRPGVSVGKTQTNTV